MEKMGVEEVIKWQEEIITITETERLTEILSTFYGSYAEYRVFNIAHYQNCTPSNLTS